MTLAVIVQARHGSTRLPGKILNPLGRKTALIRVLERCERIPGVDKVICAIPDTKADDAVADNAIKAGFDMDMAASAGMRSIGVNWGYHTPEKLQAATRLVDRFDQLETALAEMWSEDA